MLETPWGRTKLCVSDEAWELHSARIVDDTYGILDCARIQIRSLLSRPEALVTRVRAGRWELQVLMRRLAKLASTSDRAGRTSRAMQLAAGIFALSGREQYSGMCGLALRVLCHIGAANPGRSGLWTGARLVARDLGLGDVGEPIRGIRLAHGISPGGGGGNGQLEKTALEALEVAMSALADLPTAHPEGLAPLDSYYRRVISLDPEGALVLVRGETARQLRADARYLRVCGVASEATGGWEAADAWPDLLARLSTVLTSAQAVVTLCNRFSPELLQATMSLAAAAKDPEGP